MKYEKRKNKGYKIVDSEYNAAMKKSKSIGIPLANIVEQAVRYHGEGYELFALKNNVRLTINRG